MSNNLDKISQFLEKFSSPVVIRYDTKKKKPILTNTGLSIHVAKNDVLPEQLLFTPNGNFQIKNGDDSIVKINDKTSTNPGVYCFVITKIKHSDRDMLLNAMIFHGIKPTYEISTIDNVAFILMFDSKDVEKINISYSLSQFSKILKYFIEELVGINYAPIPNQLTVTLSVPYSSYYYEGDYGIKDKEIELIEHSGVITFDTIRSLYMYTKDGVSVRKDNGILISKLGSESVNFLDKLPIEDVLGFATEAGHKLTIDDGVILSDGKSCGYIYNDKTKRVNCFYPTYYPISNRLRGSLGVFLYHLFNKNITKLSSSIQYKYGEDIDGIFKITKDVIEDYIDTSDYTIEFINDKVYLINNLKEGVKKAIFRVGMKILGVGTTKKGENGFTFDNDVRVIICEIKGKKVFIECLENKNKFNNKYKDICFFYGVDNDLGFFYDAVFNSDHIDKMNLITENGYHYDKLILGGEIIVDNDENGDSLVVCDSTYDLIYKEKIIPYKDYLVKLRELYSDDVALPVFLQAIALAGMNLRSGNEVYPGLLLTGMTGSGKSVLSNLLRTVLGYANKARVKGLPALTPQPLSVLGSDPSILFLEELTQSVSLKTEELLRNVINRDKGGRGFGSFNIEYNYRSPLFVTGERNFLQESLNNRFVVTHISEIHWRTSAFEGKNKIIELSEYGCHKEIYKKYLDVEYELSETYDKMRKMLSKHTEPRHADVRGYLFAVNKLFGFGINEAILIDIMKRNLKLLGFGGKRTSVNHSLDFSNLLIKSVFQKKMIYTIDEDDINDIVSHSFIVVDDEFLEKHRVKLRFTIEQLNSKFGEDRIIQDDGQIIFNLHTRNANDFDFELEKIVTKIAKTVGNRNVRY